MLKYANFLEIKEVGSFTLIYLFLSQELAKLK